MGHLQNEACFRDASSSGTVRIHSHSLPWVPRWLTACSHVTGEGACLECSETRSLEDGSRLNLGTGASAGQSRRCCSAHHGHRDLPLFA